MIHTLFAFAGDPTLSDWDGVKLGDKSPFPPREKQSFFNFTDSDQSVLNFGSSLVTNHAVPEGGNAAAASRTNLKGVQS